jgi:hypothetical protein
MNQPLNYTVDGIRYYYQLDTSKWYIINNDNTINYINDIDNNL